MSPRFRSSFCAYSAALPPRQADVGECLATADRVLEGSFESWTKEWTRTAERVAAAAQNCAQAGHRVSAADAFLRAANYFRAAEFYLHGNPSDPRIQELSDRSSHCFKEGLCASAIDHHFVDIAYEGTTLPGIFYPAGPKRGPALIVQTGFDGTIDGLLPWAQATVRRG
ncbi:MAG TPA: hypothetical protein VH595_08685 [Verrucomicrobiae bacterium]|jgi:hypothetical protein|nr:hypothetical protein [Verrucomicrobiae bacterium]